MSTISNRGAYHEFFIEDTYVAGMVLLGTEVKSIREGKVSFNDSYCLFHKDELWIKSLYIAEYTFGTDNNHIATRDRKLLLNRREMSKIQAKMKEKGFTLVPTGAATLLEKIVAHLRPVGKNDDDYAI
jgi:SsrA-binding protein